jgi:8-oxo-dGTP diphosphatase
MKLVPVALALFHEISGESLNVWVQTREDDGPYHGLLEFPGGGIEAGETPLLAAVREVAEEVGIAILPEDGKFMGTYQNDLPSKTILLYVFLFPRTSALEGKGQWLTVQHPELSASFKGLIPQPNHKIIDDLFLALLS